MFTHLKLLKVVLRDLNDELGAMNWSLGERVKTRWTRQQQNHPIEWHPREEVPPVGDLWATDGSEVWMIHSDGKPIPPGATAVKRWAPFQVPFAPKLLKQP